MATAAFGEEQRILSVGKAFTRGFETIRAYPLQTLGPMFLLSALPGILFQMVLFNTIMARVATGSGTGGFGLFAFLGGIGLILLTCAAFGAVIQTTVLHAEGRQPELGEILRVGIVRCLPMAAVYIIYWFCVSLASLLLIVPGIMLALMWSMAFVAVVAERPGVFGAFSRSARLTKGARWKILGLFLAVVVIYVIVLGFAGVAGATTSLSVAQLRTGAAPTFGIGQIITAVINGVVVTWVTTMFASLFIELREWKEGPDTSQLSDIFA